MSESNKKIKYVKVEGVEDALLQIKALIVEQNASMSKVSSVISIFMFIIALIVAFDTLRKVYSTQKIAM